MQITVPHYYGWFACTAGDCPDTCCAGWAIVIDEKSLNKYRKCPMPLKNRLANSIDWREGTFKQYEGRCAFLNEKNLCDIYGEAGPAMLCKTCRHYPRHMEEFEGLREIGLSLSCPEAAKLILAEEPVHFLTRETKREETYKDFDFLLFTKLVDARETMIAVLQNRRFHISVRMGLCLALAHDLQRRIDGGRIYEADRLIGRYRSGQMGIRMEERGRQYDVTGKERYRLSKAMLDAFGYLEVLKKDWPETLGSLKVTLFGGVKGAGEKGLLVVPGAEEIYEKGCLAFDAWIKENAEWTDRWPIWQEQLMVYFVFTYFCGGVYDQRPYEKMKLAVVSTLAISELARAVWLQTGDLTKEDYRRLAGQYSREVEHSDVNLNRLEELFRREEVFGLENLMRLLWPFT